MPFERVDRFGDVNQLAVANWFATVDAFEYREFPAITGQQFA